MLGVGKVLYGMQCWLPEIAAFGTHQSQGGASSTADPLDVRNIAGKMEPMKNTRTIMSPTCTR